MDKICLHPPSFPVGTLILNVIPSCINWIPLFSVSFLASSRTCCLVGSLPSACLAIGIHLSFFLSSLLLSSSYPQVMNMIPSPPDTFLNFSAVFSAVVKSILICLAPLSFPSYIVTALTASSSNLSGAACPITAIILAISRLFAVSLAKAMVFPASFLFSLSPLTSPSTFSGFLNVDVDCRHLLEEVLVVILGDLCLQILAIIGLPSCFWRRCPHGQLNSPFNFPYPSFSVLMLIVVRAVLGDGETEFFRFNPYAIAAALRVAVCIFPRIATNRGISLSYPPNLCINSFASLSLLQR